MTRSFDEKLDKDTQLIPSRPLHARDVSVPGAAHETQDLLGNCNRRPRLLPRHR